MDDVRNRQIFTQKKDIILLIPEICIGPVYAYLNDMPEIRHLLKKTSTQEVAFYLKKIFRMKEDR